MRFLSHAPYLRVADMQRSLAFYRDGLGFSVTTQMDDENGVFWASLEKDGMTLMISNRPSRFMDWIDLEQGNVHEHEEGEDHAHVHGISAVHDGCLNFVTFLYVEDVDAAYMELKSRSIEPLDRPEDKFYNLRECLIVDPDGYYYAVCQRLDT